MSPTPTRRRAPDHPSDETFARLAEGHHPTVVAAMRRAVRKYGREQLDPAASIVSDLFSVSIAPGSSPATTPVEVDLPFIATAVSARFYSTDPADDSSDIEITLQQPNGAGYLLGTARAGLNLTVLAEVDHWKSLTSPWIFTPNEALTLVAKAVANLSGDVTVVLGFEGLVLNGFR